MEETAWSSENDEIERVIWRENRARNRRTIAFERARRGARREQLPPRPAPDGTSVDRFLGRWSAP
jgi:hypothetical protein